MRELVFSVAGAADTTIQKQQQGPEESMRMNGDASARRVAPRLLSLPVRAQKPVSSDPFLYSCPKMRVPFIRVLSMRSIRRSASHGEVLTGGTRNGLSEEQTCCAQHFNPAKGRGACCRGPSTGTIPEPRSLSRLRFGGAMSKYSIPNYSRNAGKVRKKRLAARNHELANSRQPIGDVVMSAAFRGARDFSRWVTGRGATQQEAPRELLRRCAGSRSWRERSGNVLRFGECLP